jgi:hypothetical protein
MCRYSDRWFDRQPARAVRMDESLCIAVSKVASVCLCLIHLGTKNSRPPTCNSPRPVIGCSFLTPFSSVKECQDESCNDAKALCKVLLFYHKSTGRSKSGRDHGAPQCHKGANTRSVPATRSSRRSRNFYWTAPTHVLVADALSSPSTPQTGCTPSPLAPSPTAATVLHRTFVPPRRRGGSTCFCRYRTPRPPSRCTRPQYASGYRGLLQVQVFF